MASSVLPRNVSAALKLFGEPHLHTDGELLLLTFAPDGSLLSLEEQGVLRRWNAQTLAHGTHFISKSDFDCVKGVAGVFDQFRRAQRHNGGVHRQARVDRGNLLDGGRVVAAYY